MRCGTRALSLTSLGFGLVATGALSLAVATDYWLFTVEPVIPDFNDTAIAETYEDQELLDDTTSSEAPGAQDALLVPDGGSMLPIVINMHSGLWRLCIINEGPGASASLSIYDLVIARVNVSLANSTVESAASATEVCINNEPVSHIATHCRASFPFDAATVCHIL